MRPIGLLRILRTPITAATVIMVLGISVGAASANRIRQSSTSARTTFASAEFAGGFGTTRCSLTLEGSMHSGTGTKTSGALVGYVTRASLGPCPSGSATVNTSSLPWHVRYESFTGTLPNITIIRNTISGAEWSIRETFGITCTVSRTAELTTTTWTLSSGVVTRGDLGGSILTSCGTRGTLSGSGSVVVPGTTTRITVTLI
jgi:hypothetical protein